MDSTLRYTEGIDFDIDEYFAVKLAELNSEQSDAVLRKIIPLLPDVEPLNGWSQLIGGVIKVDYQLFFMVEFLKQEEEIPFLLDFHEIEVDEYLDLYLESNTIENYENVQTISDGQGTDERTKSDSESRL